MLKIKDNVDLKILEDYGLTRTNECIDCYELEERIGYTFNYIFIPIYNREILGNYLDKVYDLIKADLVEKVGN